MMMNIDPNRLQRWSDDIAGRVNELGHHVNDLRKFKMIIEYEKQIESTQQLTERLQSNAMSYTNLIIVAGYAGFFTFWATLAKELPHWLYSLTGFLIMVSLLTFIGWEIFKMIWNAIYLNSIQKQLTAEPPSAATLKNFQAAISKFERSANRVWIWFLIPSVMFGLSAGLCLLGFFAWRIWQSAI
jgi:hypothetical protein